MIYFSRAFDTVLTESLLRKLLMLGVPVCMTRWLRAFRQDWRASVHFGTATSSKHRMANGLPPGTVLGPILFVCFINDLAKAVPEKTHIFCLPMTFASGLKIARLRAPPCKKASTPLNSLLMNGDSACLRPKRR
jgi:hypothetical protein